MGPLEHQYEISTKMALEAEATEQKNVILAPAKGSTHHVSFSLDCKCVG